MPCHRFGIQFGDNDMKRLLLVLAILVAVAASGCTEKGPSAGAPGSGEIKAKTLKAAENLSTFSLTSSVNQTLKLNSAGGNATPEKLTTISDSVETRSSVNLTGFMASASGTTKSLLQVPGQPANSSSTEADVYQIGNSTYIKDDSGNWTHLKDPRSTVEVWGNDSNNQIKALVERVNQSQFEVVGSESVGGEESYKLKIVPEGSDYFSLYNTAFEIAAKLVQYPMLVPSINTTEINETLKMEKLVWVSQATYLPVRYENSMSFRMRPVVVGGLDPKTGQMSRLNQSVRLGEVSVNIVSTELYYGFNKPVTIMPPEEALKAPPIVPTPVEAAPQASAA